MTPLFKKLNLKGEAVILVVDAPKTFEQELVALEGVTIVRDSKKANDVAFAIIFAVTQAQVDAAARRVLPRVLGDATVWFAYPKGSSRRYRCEFNRDSGWERVGAAGFEPVRQVAIDEDWTALRFRKVEYIKVLRRDPKLAISDEGKRRSEKP